MSYCQMTVGAKFADLFWVLKCVRKLSFLSPSVCNKRRWIVRLDVICLRSCCIP